MMRADCATRLTRWWVVWPAVLIAASCAGDTPTTVSPEPSLVESTAFAQGEEIPPEHTCDGADTPPSLRWDVVHPDAEELVVLVDDDDAEVRGRRFVHWVVAGLAPQDGEIEDGRLPLDRRTGLEAGFSVDEFVEATRGHELAAGVLTGRYGRAR